MTSLSPPVQTFLQEAQEVLESLEAQLLELEADPGNAQLIDAVFRNLHTLKGSGEMFGFTALAGFMHAFETGYDHVRAGRAQVTQALIDVSLKARDHIQRLIDAGTDPEENARLAEAPEGRELLDALDAITGDGTDRGSASAGGGGEDGPPADDAPGETAWRIRFRPAADALGKGTRPDLLIEELASLGRAEVRCLAGAVPPLSEMDPTACYLAWEVRLETAAGREAIEDVFIFADEGELVIEPEAATGPGDAPGPASSGETPGDRGAAEDPAPGGAEEPAPGRATAARAPAAGGGEETGAQPARAAQKADSVRVQSDRLDALMDQLGELVIAQARLNRISHDLGEPALVATAEEIERLITGLRDATLSIRMLPIGGVFGKFRRLVRDLSGELGKRVSLVTEGGETELDKNVIDCLSEPLVHIIRNAVDHGIEPAGARAAAGKPAEATVQMTARQAGGEVLITVADDGGGLDAEAIRARAVDRGLIEAGDALTETELQQLIFAPGFSTARALSNVSGRGVGMDAVRSVITDLGGEVEVLSERGQGTEVTLRLPLTLAIIEGLLVRVGAESYVLPLSSVDECVDLGGVESRRESGRSILTIRDELVPFLDLEALFGFAGEREAPARKIVIVRTERRRIGLLVDDIIGQHQTVIKSLSPYHREIPGLAGGTILGDGAVALILDPPALVKGAGPQLNEAA
jgi:two-component system chemotaxis sensor kinase CheA